MALNVNIRDDPRQLALLERIAVATEAIAIALKAETGPSDEQLAALTADINARAANLGEVLPKP
jgi:hypothetical protein